MQIDLKMDSNGNQVAVIKIDGFRAFRIQTNQNLRCLHSAGIRKLVYTTDSMYVAEVVGYVSKHGTAYQKKAIKSHMTK